MPQSFQQLGSIVDAPEFIWPWLDRFYEPGEIRLLEQWQHLRSVESNAISIERLKAVRGFDENAIDRLLKRGVVSQADHKVIPADFHKRYDIWAAFEGYKDIPKAITTQLNRWELDHYIITHKSAVENIKKTGKLDPGVVTPRYLLLNETLAVLDEVEHVYLWPCNCRSMIQSCSKPVYTCLRFENSQGQGYEISREKAKEIVRLANQKGLMQSGELGRKADGRLIGAICNCCVDCCFPHLLARELNAEKIWPNSRHLAAWNETRCSSCGRCIKRCPFEAFTLSTSEENKNIIYDKTRCRGCGLCHVTCPADAIEMIAL